MHRKRTRLIQIPALILSLSLFLTGCVQKTPEPAPEPAPDGASAAEEQFQEMIDDLFYDSVTSSGLTMHSMLTDPEAYGITEYPDTLGDYSLQGIRDDYAELNEDYETLRSIDREALSPALQSDNDILKTYMET